MMIKTTMPAQHSLKRNIVLNVLGAGVPLLVSIVTVPLYLNSVGATRYGILALVWLFVGYFGLLDFGISRATVNHISKIPADDLEARQKVFWSALWLNLAIGLVAMVLAYPLAFYVMRLIHFEDPQIRVEIFDAIPWLCLTIPLTVVSAVGIGALEARDRFDLANLIQIFGSIATQIVPVLIARQVGVRLDMLILGIVLTRATAFVVLFLSVKKQLPLQRPIRWDAGIVRSLIGYGGQASLSTIISLMIEALDRFIIGAKLGAVEVAAYAIPLSIADKLRIIPKSLGRAAFPRLSRLPEDEARVLYDRLLQSILCVMTPMVLVAIYGTKMLLALWLGEHGRQSEVAAVILLCGAWFNAVAVVPFVYLQARGRPGVTATINLLEFIPFVVALFVLISNFGVVGAAVAWAARMAIDAVALLCVVKLGSKALFEVIFASAFVLLATYWMSTQNISWLLAICSVSVVLAVFLPAAKSILKLTKS